MTTDDHHLPPSTYKDNQTILGIVQTCLPSVGIALVRSCSSYVDTFFACYIYGLGHNTGAGNSVAPAVGSLVQVTVNPNTRVGHIIACVASDRSPQSVQQLAKILHYDWNKQQNDMLFIQALKVLIQEKTQSNTTSSPGQFTQDSYAGDVIIGQRKGPIIFAGRTQIIVKGSGLAYTEYSALDNSIVTVAQNYQFNSFTTRIVNSPQICKHHVSMSIKQGLGLNQAINQSPIQYQHIHGDKGSSGIPDVKLKYKYPIYRHQSFQGGLVNGQYFNIVIPYSKDSNQTIVVASQYKDYTGTISKFSTTGLRQIKTANLVSIAQIDNSDSISISESEKLKYYGVDQSIVINKFLQQNSTLGLLDLPQEKRLRKKDITKSKQSASSKVQWEASAGQTTQYLQMPDKAKIPLNQQTIYNNNSFINQQQDGSIIIKDGWGSQIRMFGGNIYISPALDIFMRPGRDFMTLVPRNAQISTGNQLALASHKNIDIAAGENAKIASGVLDQNGFTVLQSRCTNKNATGVVIRSNGNMSITSSQDMYIGVNDKTSTNAGDKATKGNGTIRIQGSILNLDAKSYLKATAGIIGLYGYNGGTGSGITIANNVISTSTNSVLFDASNIIMGGIEGQQKVSIGNQQAQFTLTKGSDKCNLMVNGQFRCKDTIIKGSLITQGQIVGTSYLLFAASTYQERIFGMSQKLVDRLREQIKKVFEQQINLPTISYPQKLQTWYNDDYICSKQLKFLTTGQLGFNPEYKMPSMCWQIESDGEGTLKPIKVKPTGEGEQTFSYPGKQAWQSGKISSIDDKYTVVYDTNLLNGYPTNTK